MAVVVAYKHNRLEHGERDMFIMMAAVVASLLVGNLSNRFDRTFGKFVCDTVFG